MQSRVSGVDLISRVSGAHVRQEIQAGVLPVRVIAPDCRSTALAAVYCLQRDHLSREISPRGPLRGGVGEGG